MLIEDRLRCILDIVEKQKSVSVLELTEMLNTSVSTIRRDLTTLDNKGLLIKVHGGAVAIDNSYTTRDADVNQRLSLNKDEKLYIAKYAASLITSEDYVYIDAGTTTALMLDYITAKGAIFVTNAISHGKKLSSLGFTVYMLGGELKASTEAMVGYEAVLSLSKYNFTKGFFGSNGVSLEKGFTTPDLKEAAVKEQAIKRCREAFILCDQSKFNKISPITFGAFEDSTVITTKLKDKAFSNYSNILEVPDNDIHSNL